MRWIVIRVSVEPGGKDTLQQHAIRGELGEIDFAKLRRACADIGWVIDANIGRHHPRSEWPALVYAMPSRSRDGSTGRVGGSYHRYPARRAPWSWQPERRIIRGGDGLRYQGGCDPGRVSEWWTCRLTRDGSTCGVTHGSERAAVRHAVRLTKAEFRSTGLTAESVDSAINDRGDLRANGESS